MLTKIYQSYSIFFLDDFIYIQELENLKLNELSEHSETTHENPTSVNLETNKAACDKITGNQIKS